MKALVAVTSTLAASAIAVSAALPAYADPASDDARFYKYLLNTGGLVSLRAQENFPLIRIEALQACERMTVDGFKMDAYNEIPGQGTLTQIPLMP